MEVVRTSFWLSTNDKTTMNKHCSETGCGEPVQNQAYKGRPYCIQHYTQLIDGELLSLHKEWQEGEKPCERFKYMLGRVSYEQNWPCNESFLSAARIRNRSYHLTKTSEGCIFQITRHPGGHTIYISSRRIVQTWLADLSCKTLTLTDVRPWKRGDPDPGWD